MTTNHNRYLNIAFQLAEKNLGQTKLNPSVGAVIVKNNLIISTGVTSKGGRPHAEYNALKKKKNFYGATLYTTLEPCAHFGRTPPCVNIIKKKKIKNVYYAFEDTDVRTYKQGKKILNKDRIKTKLIKNYSYKNFYSDYYFNKKFELPFTSAKIALSKDYYTIKKNSKWITNEYSRKTVHLIRSKYDCIFSTSKSINKDNSLLNCRIEGLTMHNPDLLIIDLNLNLKKNLLLNKLLKSRRTYLITHKKNIKKIAFFKKKGFKFIFINSLKNKKDFKTLLKRIYKMGYSRVLFETGLTFLNSLLKLKILNNLFIFQNERKLLEKGHNNTKENLLKRFKLAKKIKVNLQNDTLYQIEFSHV